MKKNKSSKTVLKAAIDNKNMVLINLKIKQDDLTRIKSDAEKYHLGNLSAWIRYCCLNYKVEDSELIKI